MASTKEYCDYILEQLSEVPNITCRPMMGEYLLYSNGTLFGGIDIGNKKKLTEIVIITVKDFNKKHASRHG